MYQLYVTFHSAPKTLGLDIVLIPLHSPLLGESLLVSFPSLNNMLKFSECSRLIWGQNLSCDTHTHSAHRIINIERHLASSAIVEYEFQSERVTIANYTLNYANNKRFDRFNSDPQTGVEWRQASLCNLRSEYRCSMCPAIHTISRILLRPSSTYEPSDPPLKFLFNNFCVINNLYIVQMCV